MGHSLPHLQKQDEKSHICVISVNAFFHVCHLYGETIEVKLQVEACDGTCDMCGGTLKFSYREENSKLKTKPSKKTSGQQMSKTSVQ